MALHDAGGWHRTPHWARLLRPLARRFGNLLRPAAIADASFASIVLLASIPLFAGILVLVTPGRILSREMTCDFVYNLSGAWHLHYGHVAHVDFHGPLGELNFLLTLAGFRIVGPTPHAFLVGVIIVALAVFMLASWAAWRRLPLLPAVLFVVFTNLLVLMPANVGDRPSDFSFAMSYNRYCWSAISILALILFVPPRREWHDWLGDWMDVAVGGVLLAAMFYLKVTYFVTGLAAVGFAAVLFPHVRSWWGAWAAIVGLAIANAAAPYSRAYLQDIWAAANAGGIRTGLALHIGNFFANSESYAAYVAAFMAACFMYLRGLAPLRLAAATGFIFVVSLALLSQNAQLRGTPLSIVVAFIFYDQLRQHAVQKPSNVMVPLFVSLMIFPLLSIGVSSTSLIAYFARTHGNERLVVVDRTQLKGLAVWAEDGKLLEAFGSGRIDYKLLNSARRVGVRYELSPFEYVETIMEAAALLQDGRHVQGNIVLLDQVNPLPFMLGIEPARGGNLWSGVGEPVHEASTVLGEADHVLIPKFPSFSDSTETAVQKYGAYMAEHFPNREETQSWVVLSRKDAVHGPPGHVPQSSAAYWP